MMAAVIGIIVCQRVYRNHHRHDKPAAVQAGANVSNPNKVAAKACQILTLADAKQVLDSSAAGGSSSSNTLSKDLAVSLCVYSPGTATIVPVKTVSLLVRAPKTPVGAASNERQFSNLKPVDSQAVAGYGQDAYWDPRYGQLNILKNSTWYVLTYGSPIPADRTLDQTKQMADIIIAKI